MEEQLGITSIARAFLGSLPQDPPHPLLRAARLRHSRGIRLIGGLPGAGRYLLTSSAGRHFRFEIGARMGMGAMLTHAVQLLRLARYRQVPVRIAFTNPLYTRAPGEDWLPDLFTRRDPPPAGRPVRIAIRNEEDYRLFGMPGSPGIAEARALFFEHFAFGDAVEAEFSNLLGKLGPLDRTIGVHFRGTDKAREARRASATAMGAAIADATRLNGSKRIFLATDEPAFAAYLSDQFRDYEIVTYCQEGLIRIPGEPFHFAPGDGFAKGMEAIMLMRALAACSCLVRTASHLSGWAQVLRPDLPTFFIDPLGLRERSFPDAEILQNAAYAVCTSGVGSVQNIARS